MATALYLKGKINEQNQILQWRTIMDNGGIWPGDESYFQNIRETALQDTIKQLTKELAEARAELERLALEIENKQYTITCASEENQQLKESLAEARAEIERLKGVIISQITPEAVVLSIYSTSTEPAKDERDKLIEQMREALQWYKEQVSSCNRNGDAGELARDRLAKDVGKRAEAALAAERGE